MDWLKDNSYIAEWLAIPVAIAMAYLTVKGKLATDVNWSRLIIRGAFIASLSVVLTEGHSTGVHLAAVSVCTMTLIDIIWNQSRT